MKHILRAVERSTGQVPTDGAGESKPAPSDEVIAGDSIQPAEETRSHKGALAHSEAEQVTESREVIPEQDPVIAPASVLPSTNNLHHSKRVAAERKIGLGTRASHRRQPTERSGRALWRVPLAITSAVLLLGLLFTGADMLPFGHLGTEATSQKDIFSGGDAQLKPSLEGSAKLAAAGPPEEPASDLTRELNAQLATIPPVTVVVPEVEGRSTAAQPPQEPPVASARALPSSETDEKVNPSPPAIPEVTLALPILPDLPEVDAAVGLQPSIKVENEGSSAWRNPPSPSSTAGPVELPVVETGKGGQDAEPSAEARGSAAPTLLPPEPQKAQQFTPSQRAIAVSDLARGYFAAWSAQTEAESFGRYYGDTIDFQKKLVTRSQLIKEKRRFMQRWPQRSYTLREASLAADCRAQDNLCTVRSLYDYKVANPALGRVGTGVQELELRIAFAGTEPIIVYERSELQPKSAAPSPAAGRPSPQVAPAVRPGTLGVSPPPRPEQNAVRQDNDRPVERTARRSAPDGKSESAESSPQGTRERGGPLRRPALRGEPVVDLPARLLPN